MSTSRSSTNMEPDSDSSTGMRDVDIAGVTIQKPLKKAEEEEEKHEPHWVARAAFPLLSLGMMVSEVLLGWLVFHGWYLAAVPVMLAVSHLMHGQLIGFHEASHGMLRHNRKLNEIDGVLIGMISFMSFSLYRASHQTHHMHLGTEKDEELWPFTQREISRPKRVAAAVLELLMGLYFTPFLFMRSFFRKGSPIRAKRVRKRIWMELMLMAVVWTSVIVTVELTNTWRYFLWLYFLPAWLAGNMQSVRKYIEHVGMYGSTPNSATRSIVADTWTGKLLSFTLLHEPYHGVHHRYAGIPHANLPQHIEVLQPKTDDELPPFPSYWHAFRHLFARLRDPQVGAHWLQPLPQAHAQPSSGVITGG